MAVPLPGFRIFATCTVYPDYRNVLGAITTNKPISRTQLYTEWA